MSLFSSYSLHARSAALAVLVTLVAPGATAAPAPRGAMGRSETTDGYFIDAGGRTRDFRSVQRAWFPEQGDPHYVRALGEMGVLLGFGTLYYWLRPAINRQDWDTPPAIDRLTFHAVRFDNNLALTNFTSHPFAGATYYGAARLSNLTVPESALYAMLTSAFWEYVLEWREQVSINDMIFTPSGGIPIGAFLFRLTDYLNSAPAPAGAGNEVARYSLGLPRAIQPRSIDPNAAATQMPRDRLGFSSAYTHEFRVSYDAAFTAIEGVDDTLLHAVSLDGEIVAIAGFLRPGRFHKWFASDNFTELHGRMSFGRTGLVDGQLRADGTLVGYYAQSVEGAREATHGIAGMIGLPVGLRYVERDYLSQHDMYASTHMGGLTVAFWAFREPFGVRGDIEGRYDFSATEALALDRYRDSKGDAGVSSVLLLQGYQYGAGPAVRARVELSVDGLRIGAGAEDAYYRVVGGLDREQSQLRGAPDASDKVLEYGAWARIAVPGAPVHVQSEIQRVERSSSIGPITVTRRDTRLGVGGGLLF